MLTYRGMTSGDLGTLSADIVIAGTGIGGATLAYGLAKQGASVLLVERGQFLPSEAENWDPEAVFLEQRYKPTEMWEDGSGKPFHPGVHYCVGGNSKVFGAALLRFRSQDFETVEHEGGTSPAWPVSYEDLEPYYGQVEELYRVHGTAGQDPTEPFRSGEYPFPSLDHEPYVEELAERLRDQGLHPFPLPIGVDWGPEGRCVRCMTCDGFVCKVLAKSDADVRCVRPLIAGESVKLLTGTLAHRLITDTSGRRVIGLEARRNGRSLRIHGSTFVVACGAVNSAALLLRSANRQHPAGLANSSGQLGRNYMQHNNTAMVAVDPRRRNESSFQKTLALNDFYLTGSRRNRPLGNLQLIGKLQAPMLKTARRRLPIGILRWVAERSVDWWVMSEDLPDPNNRVTITPSGGIRVKWRPTNTDAHEELIHVSRQMLKRAGYSLVLHETFGIDTNSHQCGTAQMGTDPTDSVLDPLCRTHDVDNLLVVDGSFFPSSTATNPALTIAAQALRVADEACIS